MEFIAARYLRERLFAARERWFLWFPVGIGSGAAIYLGLRTEPDWALVLAPFIVLVPLVFLRGLNGLRVFFLAGLAVAAGFGAAKLQAERVMAPVLAERVGPVRVEGIVGEFEARPGQRPRASIETPVAARGPTELRRLRLTFDPDWDLAALKPGARVAVSAILLPPPGPSLPGAPDHGRALWFDGIGAVGYAVKPPVALGAAPEAGGLEIWRQQVADEVAARVGGEAGAIAAALLVGVRGNVPDETEERWRAAGISHILSISGLHIGLAAGIVLFGLRLILASVPALSLRIPAKKWAAAAALFAAGGYTVIAGMDVPALRSFIMTAIILVAVMTDRLAITMRLVAIAATIILLVQPDSLASPGFGMSFASVVGLVAGYEALRGPFGRWRAAGGRLARIGLVFFGILVSSLIATVATAPFAISYFGRLSVYGLLANLVAVPVTGFAIMPLLVLGAVAMPFGLDAWPFALLGPVISFVDDVAGMIAALPGAVFAIPTMSGTALALFVLGGLSLCLWRGMLRLSAVPFVVAASVLWLVEMAAPPRLMIHEEGRAVATPANGHIAALPPASPRFVIDQWRERLGFPVSEILSRRDVCRGGVCTMAIDGGGVVVTVAKGKTSPCATVVILAPGARAPDQACPPGTHILDAESLSGRGTLTLDRDGHWRDVSEERGLRPWTPAWWRMPPAVQ